MIVRGNSLSLPLANNSVDAVCCDPPYGLSFMGKDWDRAVAIVVEWTEGSEIPK